MTGETDGQSPGIIAQSVGGGGAMAASPLPVVRCYRRIFCGVNVALGGAGGKAAWRRGVRSNRQHGSDRGRLFQCRLVQSVGGGGGNGGFSVAAGISASGSGSGGISVGQVDW